MNESRSHENDQRTEDRWFSGIFGVLFLIMAAAIAWATAGERTIGISALILLIAVLGLEAVYSAIKKRPSLISRIGPLP